MDKFAELRTLAGAFGRIVITAVETETVRFFVVYPEFYYVADFLSERRTLYIEVGHTLIELRLVIDVAYL